MDTSIIIYLGVLVIGFLIWATISLSARPHRK